MKQMYQVTLFSTTGKYKPVSCIITREHVKGIDLSTDKINRKSLVNAGVQAICRTRLWDKKDLTNYGYLKAKVRLFDPVKIKAENAARYERIKAEKYASGEWKAPKGAIK